MTYRLVALDLDGTLLDSALQIRRQTIDALRQVRARGVQVMIVTGRHHTAAHAYWHQLQLETPAICCNGTYVYDFRHRRPLAGNPLTRQEARELLAVVRAHRVHAMVYIDEAMTYEVDAPHIAGLRRWSASLPESVRPCLEPVESFEQVIEDAATVWKFLVASDEPDALAACEQEVGNLPAFTCVRSARDRADIARAGNSKGQRLAEYLAQQGIAPREVIAFGDQNNDKEMLELAGLGVAMGNSHDAVRGCADWVTGHNDSNGIADVLQRFILTAA